jgi:O-antigen/teichoic acid export membrane protein
MAAGTDRSKASVVGFPATGTGLSAERTVARNAAWLIVQPLLLNGVSLVSTAYIARQLGSGEWGRFNLGLAFVAMFAPLAFPGLSLLTVRHVAQNREAAGAYLGQMLVLRTLLAAATALIVLAAAPLGGRSAGTETVIRIAALGLIVVAARDVFADAFQAFEKMRAIAIAHSVGGVLLTAGSVLVVALGGGIAAMSLAYSLGPLCACVLLAYWAWNERFRPHPVWNLPVFARLLGQAMPFFLIGVLDAISSRIDLLVLAHTLGETSVGYYSAAMILVDRAMVLTEGAATALLPAIAHRTACAPEEAIRLVRNAALWLLAICLPAALCVTIISPLLIHVIFGPQYIAAVPVLAIGIWRLPAMSLQVIAGGPLLAIKREDYLLRTNAVAIIASILLMVPAIRFYGPMGAALCLAIRPVLAFLLRLPLLMTRFRGFCPGTEVAKIGLGLVVMAIPLAFVPTGRWSPLTLALVPLSLVLYAITLHVLRIVPVPRIALHAVRQRPQEANEESLATRLAD